MKISELEQKIYDNSSVVVSEEIFSLLPKNLTEDKEAIDEYSSYRIKIEDHDHFLNFLSFVPRDKSFILEDNNQKYIITGDFAEKV